MAERMILRTTQALAVAFFLAASVFAQSNGNIAGTVKDPNGGVVPGATVTITNKA